MPTLTLKFKDKIIKEYRIEKGGSLTIGRRTTNDIFIENLAVSGNHAKLDSVGDGFLFTDLQSKNGSFINEQLVTSHYLKHDDTIIIGKHTLVFAYQKGEDRPNDTEQDMDKTMVMDTGQYRKMLAKSTPDPGHKSLGKKKTGILSMLTGGEGEVKITKKITKLGKDPSSDIVVGGLMVGKTAATISQRPIGYYLSYIGGIAKPKVNGKAVKETILLKDFDIIEIGPTKMQFVGKE